MLSRRFTGFLLVGLFFLIFGIGMNPTVQADNLLQNVPRLDGMKVYFSEANGEASRFDRTATGLSHFAGLLGELGANLYTLEWRTGVPADANLVVIAGPANALQAAANFLKLEGFAPIILGDSTEGEAADLARLDSRLALDQAHDHPPGRHHSHG